MHVITTARPRTRYLLETELSKQLRRRQDFESWEVMDLHRYFLGKYYNLTEVPLLKLKHELELREP